MDRQSPPPQPRHLFGRRLKELAALAGHTQGDLARLIDFAASYVSAVQRGAQRPSVNFVRRVAAVYEQDPVELLELAGLPTAEQERPIHVPTLVQEVASRTVEEALRRWGRPPAEDVIARAERVYRDLQARGEITYEPDLDAIHVEANTGPDGVAPEDVEFVRRYLWAKAVLRRHGEPV